MIDQESFGEDPLEWQSFIEIGEMACSKTAQCSRRHTLNTSACGKRFLSIARRIKTPLLIFFL